MSLIPFVAFAGGGKDSGDTGFERARVRAGELQKVRTDPYCSINVPFN